MACACQKPNCPGNCGCAGKPETQYVGDIPVDNLTTLADYFIGVREVEEPSTGNVKETFVRVPSGRLFPNDSMDNIIAIEPNNDTLTIPENQVLAVRVANEGSMNIVRVADAAHPAVMLAVGKLADLVLVQNSGFVSLPNGHEYVIGVQYYLGENGQPVTDASISGQKLFVPVSETRLAVNIG